RVEYTLNDVAGRVVHSAVITNERSTIDVSAMPAGFYTLTLRNGSSVWSTRVLVQR
ncbi:MAG: T9SS type A sorting domain-containing protein, partial [Flavobacteriales bacterium]|nr:T9SS type A sorting domain-containing protein [Flavobacteriales bacterium]